MASNKVSFYVDVMASNSGVTGSCNLCVVHFPNGRVTKFIVDCGMYQEKKFDKYNNSFVFNPKDVDFALITHGHIDHIGKLPLLTKCGFNGPIYATNNTVNLIMKPALEDSHRVAMEGSQKQMNKPIYQEAEIQRVLDLSKGCDYDTTYFVTNEIKAVFIKNQHLVGAALIFVQISFPGNDDINFLFTGDYNCKNVFLDADEHYDWFKDLPITIVQESTYGEKKSNEVEYIFNDTIIDAISRKKTIILPSYSLGRTQDVLYRLKCMQDDGTLSTDVPIYIDGKLGINYTKKYGQFQIKEEMKDFMPKNSNFVDKTSRNSVLSEHSCKIIITSSGTGSYGPAKFYLPEYLSNKKALIFFTGYTPKDTMGEVLKRTEYGKRVKYWGQELVKRAEVDYTGEFSAHAKSDELLEFLGMFTDIKLILIGHGEQEIKNIFFDKVIRKIKAKDVKILDREFFYRIGPYGLVKSATTKFD